MSRIHILSLPHTDTTGEYSWCAYTQKNRKLANMLTDCGREVYLYAAEKNEARCKEHVAVVDRAWQADKFKNYNWSRDVFNDFDPAGAVWSEWNVRCIQRVHERAQKGDILGVTMGCSQQPVAQALPYLRPVEVGIGYSGVWAPFRVYESYAWMHHLAAKQPSDHVRWFDTVIPNSFDMTEFPAGDGKGGYDLFIGRFIQNKGVEVAVEATRHLGVKLKVAGQGGKQQGSRILGGGFAVAGDHLEYVGVVGPVERARLMGGARCVWVPTIYLEPFGGVAVEAMLCGTPVVTSDYGAFTETVQQGVTGFRCRTLAEFVEAGKKVEALDRTAIRQRATSLYSTDVVQHQYDAYLKRLDTLSGKGWYQL